MLIRLISFLSPILLAIAIPFLLTKSADTKPLIKQIIPPAIAMLILLFILLVILVIAGGIGFTGFLKLSLFIIAYSVMITAFTLMLLSFNLSGVVVQSIVTILLLLMIGTVFYANPLIEQSSGETRQSIIQCAINLNPILIIGADFFNYDMILAPQMYKISLIQYYPHNYPEWYCVTGVYLAIALILFILARIKLRFLPHKAS
jgi:hypothetical protein